MKINVIGKSWQGLTCHLHYTFEHPISQVNRKVIREWLDKNAGDFQQIYDFNATIGDVEIVKWDKEYYEEMMFQIVFGGYED